MVRPLENSSYYISRDGSCNQVTFKHLYLPVNLSLNIDRKAVKLTEPLGISFTIFSRTASDGTAPVKQLGVNVGDVSK